MIPGVHQWPCPVISFPAFFFFPFFQRLWPFYRDLSDDTVRSSVTITGDFFKNNINPFLFRRSYCIGIKKLTDHTAAGHAVALNEVFDVYDGFKKKINRLTNDKADVISSTAGILKVSWFGCFPHTLNLVVKVSFQSPRDLNSTP